MDKKENNVPRDPFPLWASILAFILMCFAIYAFSFWLGGEVQERELPSIEVTKPSS